MTWSAIHTDHCPAPDTAGTPALDLQAGLLDGVSRTFALTIPQLPPSLSPIVANAYLLCRIIDTIEDEPTLNLAQKQGFSEHFVSALTNAAHARTFVAQLTPLLSQKTSPAEHVLIRHTPEVLAITAGFTPHAQRAIYHCVTVMAHGMVEFSQIRSLSGLVDLAHLDRYCYFVAGVVGELLTALFCDYSPAIAQRQAALSRLAVSFGQGLQMTNILKDIWEDRARGACWLPREVFRQHGFDLAGLTPGQFDPRFGQALDRLIALACWHLERALDYTCLLPSHETRLRNFCLWALGMAVLTLRKIHRHPDFTAGHQVKISRRTVRLTVTVSRLSAAHNRLLRLFFNLSQHRLPTLAPSSMAPHA